MSEAIQFTRGMDLSGLRLEQGPRGHVYSPWFTFPVETYNEHGRESVNYAGREYQDVKRASAQAFADFLKLGFWQIVVTERIDHDGTRWWRLGTKGRCELPKPIKRLPAPENRGAIDI